MSIDSCRDYSFAHEAEIVNMKFKYTHAQQRNVMKYLVMKLWKQIFSKTRDGDYEKYLDRGCESQPKPKAKANAKADPSGRMYSDEVVTDIYYDATMSQIDRQTIHSNSLCSDMRNVNARRLRLCRWCQTRGQLYHGRPCAGSIVHFTQWGNCYHTSTGCRGLDLRNKNYKLMDGIGCSECM